jgi:hypothetical protein
MHDDKRTQMERMHLQEQEVLTAAEQRLTRQRLRKRALKAMLLARATVWRRFLRRRFPLDAA